MVQNDKRKDETPGPTDPFAAATAVGFAMASQALEMWFGVVSGVARASQDMLERHTKDKGEPASYAPEPKSTATVAQAAARTAVAEVERVTKTVADATAKLAENQAEQAVPARKSTKPATKKASPTPPRAEQPSNVVPLKPDLSVEPVKESAGPDLLQQSPLPAAAPTEAPPAPDVADVASPSVLLEKSGAPVKAADIAEKRKTAGGKPKTTAANTNAVEKPPRAAGPSTTLMPEDFRAPAKVDKPANPDDLKQLAGVGPKLEAVLNGLGVWTFSQIAAWTPEEVAYVEDMTGLNGRIASDKWLELAADLSRGSKAQS